MKKGLLYFLILILSLSFLTGCTKDKYKKYEDSFFDTFDTVTQIIGYAKSEDEFEVYMDKIHSRFLVLHKLFDKYKTYEGINNIKTINDNAGIKPVKVEKEIIDLIIFSKEWYYKVGKETNIAMGPVINIWSKYRDKAIENPKNAKIPPMEELKEASKHTDIEKVIVDKEKGTVFLEDANMSLDVGAVAKGYAVELVAREIEKEGLGSVLISGGGNIKAIGKPMEKTKEKWGIGIQNPDKDLIDTGSILETLFVKDYSVVSSGDYQRYFIVDGEVYHHIIDPDTLMPGDYYRAITIVTPDSGVADFLSTSAFLLPLEESKKLIESIDDTEAFWVMNDGKIETTKGMEKIMLSKGATGGKGK
ncbi:FAD:protein FMN transferase [Tissierella creatinophila]|uniref:FAD:protein FMN transferase n=1 Tax=Tissierella creatinophila DSM 6911 TaxID=1123403 RepID=A0A1U7M6W6_TISCR|nr:FAD:protein FMN transferase [Tissierella creatinophila]OLS03031.1 thiamine biosynthesis lipoprotein ApbE precursor [Tissierella creatinophila DSM 6911]